MNSRMSLYEQVIDFHNVYHAYKDAIKGKRQKTGPAQFMLNLSHDLIELHDSLLDGTYQPGDYDTFYIFEPKKRLISAAPFRDRVVHHAICRIIEPIFEKSFIKDSYACRKGKGTHQALNRFTEYAKRYRYVLKCDIKRFFPSIDHEILKNLIAEKIGDPKLMDLIRLIIDSSNPQEPIHEYFPGDDLFTPYERHKGIPIGNLTSQFFANIYLNRFDHFIKDDLGVKAYIRFVDDMAFFDNDVHYLLDLQQKAQRFLYQFRMLFHPNKCHIFQTARGIPFLGFIMFPDHRLVKRQSVTRFKRNLRSLQRKYQKGDISLKKVRASIHAWLGHVKHGDTFGLRKKLLKEFTFQRASIQ